MANEETLIGHDGQSRGNSVIKKDIYIIRNTANDLCYIGQSTDYKTRFRKHKEEARRHNYSYKSALYDAMNEIGFDNFYIEVLEHDVENYDEREIYWINKLNTISPYGYNLSTGGTRYPNLSGVMHHNASVKSEEELNRIFDMLETGEFSIKEISDAVNVPYSVIEDINTGSTYRREGYDYPIVRGVLSKSDLDRLTFDLKYSNLSYDEIAEKYNIKKGQVKLINYGNSWHRDYIEYPIRRMFFNCSRDKESVEQIARDLISTDIPICDIAQKYKCSVSTVRRINDGETNRIDTLKYPLRRIKKRMSKEEIDMVCDLLANTEHSISGISKITGVPKTTVRYINSGVAKKYKNDKYIYPIRKLKR